MILRYFCDSPELHEWRKRLHIAKTIKFKDIIHKRSRWSVRIVTIKRATIQKIYEDGKQILVSYPLNEQAIAFRLLELDEIYPV